MRDVELEEVGSFETALADDERVVAHGVGPHDDAIALAVSEGDAGLPFDDHEPSEWAKFPRSRSARPYAAAVLHLGPPTTRVPLSNIDTTFMRVQPLPDGDTLLVGTRSERYDDGTHDLNARIYGRDGSVRREFLLGDGIEDVQTTPDGRIWVSYFDEGIFGNNGWEHGTDSPPVGATGLIRWSAEGTKEWEYDPPEGWDPIDDCEALNVTDDGTWLYYYSAYVLARVANGGSVRAWRSPIDAARAIAISGDHALLYGGHSPEHDRCVLFELAETELVERERIRFLAPSGERITGKQVTGRGSFLHVFAGPRWFRLDVQQVVGG